VHNKKAKQSKYCKMSSDLSAMYKLPLHILPLLSIDLISTFSLFMFQLGYSTGAHEKPNKYTYATTIVDMIVISIVRVLVLIPLYWRIRSANGLGSFSGSAILGINLHLTNMLKLVYFPSTSGGFWCLCNHENRSYLSTKNSRNDDGHEFYKLHTHHHLYIVPCSRDYCIFNGYSKRQKLET